MPMIIGAIVLLLALLAGGAFFLFPGDAQAGEVFLVPAASAGPDPFSDAPFASPPDPGLAQPASESSTPVQAPAGTALSANSGNQPGLYGGTQDKSVCDPQQMVSFLSANPDKAQAWVNALNADPAVRLPDGQPLTTATIPAYVATLTSLVLRSDTRVTNHGFKNGRANTIQSVLQKGSAVLVDMYGVPRVKCYCGNPLLPPVASPKPPTYTGPRWPDFDPRRVTVISSPPEPVKSFDVYDFETGNNFPVPPGGRAVPPNTPFANESSPNPPPTSGGNLDPDDCSDDSCLDPIEDDQLIEEAYRQQQQRDPSAEDYARRSVEQYQAAARAGCGFQPSQGFHDDYEDHYQWAVNNPGYASTEFSNRQTMLSGCLRNN